jgi:hypothetical protein
LPKLPAPRTSTENVTGAPVDEGPDLSHKWVVAACIDVDDNAAKLAQMRRFHWIKEPLKVRADDVYCYFCKRTRADEVDTECLAKKKDNEHLIGGDQAHRAKRKPKVVPANATVVAGPSIQRRGIEARVLGE